MAAQVSQLDVTSLADILANLGAMTRERADSVKLAEIQSGRSQEDIIVSQNLATPEMLVRAKAELYNIPFIDLSTSPVSPVALSLIPQELARKFRVFPISVDTAAQELVLAMAEPLDLASIEFIEQRTGYRVRPSAAVPEAIDEYIAKRYSTTLSQEVTAALKEVSSDGTSVKTLDVTQNTGLVRQERISEVVTHIM
nr:hypothetical protein [Candidatus Woesebacteria bacterium]